MENGNQGESPRPLTAFLQGFEFVFLSDLLAIAPVDLNQCAWAIDAFAHSQRCSSAAKWIEDAIALFRAHQNATLDERFIQLSWVPGSTLLGIACHAREIKDIPRNSTTRISTLITVLLSPGRYADLIRVQRRAFLHQPIKWSMVIAEIVMRMLAEGKCLNARLKFKLAGTCAN